MTADSVNMTRITGRLFAPVLGPLMQNRWIIALLALPAALQVGLTAAGMPAWQCPVKWTLGMPGPGCGLTRAMVSLLQGQWRASIQLHAFAPLFLGIGIMLAIGSILPQSLRQKVANRIAVFECRTGIVALLMLGLLAYWIVRIINLINQ